MAGGTGGHVYPALSVADELIKAGEQVIWLGTKQGIEARLVPMHNIVLHTITIKGFRKTGIVRQLITPFLLVLAILLVFILILKTKPKLAIGFGGYVSGPGGIACKLCNKPLIIHEQNAVLGTTNKYLSRVANVKLSAFPNVMQQSIHCGNPVRSELVQINKAAVTADRALRLLVLGGSSGARKLNEILPQAIATCDIAQQIEVLHQTGSKCLTECQQNYLNLNLLTTNKTIHIKDYIDDMAEAYQWADVVICRSGAMTVWEIATVGVAALFIPYPYAIDDHQTANAQWLVENDAAMLLQEKELTPQLLASYLNRWNSGRQRLNVLAINAKSKRMPGSAQIISKYAMELG